MLNSVGNDGYSFDEWDDDFEETDEFEIPKDFQDNNQSNSEVQHKSNDGYDNLSMEDARRMSDEDICRLYDEYVANKDMEDDDGGYPF
jgi:hypothetical protein